MFKKLSATKLLLLIAITLVIVLFSVVFLSLFTYNTNQNPTHILPTPTPVTYINNSPAGIKTMNKSVQEIDRIRSALPYMDSFKSTTGENIDITIPETPEDSNQLTVNIHGIDYQVSEENEQAYIQNRSNFLTAALQVFNWIESNGGNPALIIYKWSNNDKIQQQATKWLQDH